MSRRGYGEEMAEERNRETLCVECGQVLEERSDLPIADRGPCPSCGATGRKYRVELSSTITGTSTLVARLTSQPGQIVQVGTAAETETAMPLDAVKGQPSALPIEDLPTEVIAECLRVNVNILEPDEHGQWPVEVGAFGVVGTLGVGSLDDALIEVANWIRQLAERWRQRLGNTD
jgi:hypothetical protein